MWLRPLGDAWWALFVTIALALLQGFEGAPASQLLWLRLEEILIGAVIGVASAWFVYPVRSTAVLRRRIADALAILSDAFDPATPARTGEELLHALFRMDQMAASFRASRLLTQRFRRVQPADWIDAMWGCHEPASALIEQGRTPSDVRKAIGAARKALREPDALLSVLQHARQTLTQAAAESPPPGST
jgi:uncharacterized membrane protein YccC